MAALRLSFSLGSSQYATMCVRELLKEHIDQALQNTQLTGAKAATRA